MHNNSNYNWLIGLIFLVVSFSIIAAWWFSKQFGLDFATGYAVARRFITFGILLAAAVYIVSISYFRFISILPVSIVGFLICLFPAFDYWSSRDFRNFRFDGGITYAWYATGWIQALISVTIIAGGHWLIRYLDD
jgi:hypothetical protein